MMEKKGRFNIITHSDHCVGCRLCQMRCSFRFTKCYSFSESRIGVAWNEDQPGFKIAFSELCDSCGLCARSCVYGALEILTG